MTLHLHTATRTDVLADALADVLAVPLVDPFDEEVVVVPAKGVERWLTQRMSSRLGVGERGTDGVCAGVRFLNPRSLVALLTGTERDDPWDPDRLVWPLLETIDASMHEPWCATLADHLGRRLAGQQAELRQDRRYSVARRLAGLFAAYAVQRPRLLTDWGQGRDTDGLGAALAADLLWQPELWRRLVARVPVDPPDVRHQRTVEAILAGAPLALPARLSMFGHTRMPVTELELLRAVGEVREVHLWLPQASPAAWQRLEEAVAEGPVRRSDDRTGRRLDHPLLSSLGRDSRELQRSLTVLGAARAEPVTDGAPGAATLLSRLQDDLRADRVSTVTDLDGSDRSVQVHACHGAMRQVEVLREVLVGLMEDDPTLEPRDVLVMCPDIEAYAPLFSAVFALGGCGEADHPAAGLRVRLADRGLASTNPFLAMAGDLVALAGGRATASEVLDLMATEPVRHRFGLADDDLATVTTWVEQSGIRWGIDQELRAPFGLADLRQNTWQAGLDRVLLGAAMAEEEGRTLGDCLPLDGVGSAAVDLAGRAAELVARLEATITAMREAETVDQWTALLRDGVLGLGSVAARDTWQVAQFERELDGIRDAAGGMGSRLRLADVRTLLELRLQPRPTRANFRTGTLTVCTMVPMRSVPHRVVCLVGLDDGVFPRKTIADGDDVLARDPVTGERDPRSEDRQLLLDAVLAAGEALVVTFTGADEHSGQPRPPAVPLGELLDAVDRMAPRARHQVLVRHPLQPFDPRNFTTGTLGRPEPFSFDRAELDGARAASGARHPRPPLLSGPLPPAVRGDLTLADLQAFFRHPVGGFLRQRIDVAVAQEHDEIADALPVELDALSQWAIGDRVLRRAVEGAEPTGVLLAEQFRGDLPPLRLGERLLHDICERVSALLVATAGDRGVPAGSVDVTVDLGAGRRLTGVVPDIRGDSLVRIRYSALSHRHRLASWLDLLALSAALPDTSWTARTYGWHKVGSAQLSLLGPVSGTTALEQLRTLVDVFDRGMVEPLPLPARTAYAWAEAVRTNREPRWKARDAWETDMSSPVPGEQDDLAHVRVFGRGAPLGCLLEPARADERWSPETSRLGQYAVRVWQPLFAAEEVRSA